MALAMQMPLRDNNYQDKFYTPRDLLGEFLSLCERFENLGLKLLPTEVITILFRCKLLFAVKTQHEYMQRSGGATLFNSPPVTVHWADRSNTIELLIEQSLEHLARDEREMTLISRLNAFTSAQPEDTASVQDFLDGVFRSLGLPCSAFIVPEKLIETHRAMEPSRVSYGPAEAEKFFQTPSIGCKTKGSKDYCFWKSVALLRTFLSLLRIGSFIHPGQIEFGREIKVTPLTYPVFLATHSEGFLMWKEDMKPSWAKLPDGSLHLSFGYRGYSPMWLDRRTFSPISQFVLKHRAVFDRSKNPWTDASLNDIAPALDILSSAVQMPDLGAKILLIYTCLEHFFVPENTRNNQRMYIVGGLNALKPSLVPWFEKLYKLRCDYAHRGFVIKDQETMGLTMESIRNVMSLLAAKLSVA